MAFNVIVSEVTKVVGAISPSELAFALLAPFFVGSFVTGAVLPRFNALAVLLILKPLAIVN